MIFFCLTPLQPEISNVPSLAEIMPVTAVLLLLLLLLITFMQGIYNYIPETNHDSRVYNVAAILVVTFMVHVTLFRTMNFLYFRTFVASY